MGWVFETPCQHAGVSKPVLYQHFPGKLELYLALLDTQAEMLSRAVQDALAATDDNRQRIHGVLSAYFRFVDNEGSDGAFRRWNGGGDDRTHERFEIARFRQRDEHRLEIAGGVLA